MLIWGKATEKQDGTVYATPERTKLAVWLFYFGTVVKERRKSQQVVAKAFNKI